MPVQTIDDGSEPINTFTRSLHVVIKNDNLLFQCYSVATSEYKMSAWEGYERNPGNQIKKESCL